VWRAFIDGCGIDGADVEDMIERTGLAEWGEATAADVSRLGAEYEVGDPILRLPEEGRRVVCAARAAIKAGAR
jgi:hypothetical protein